MCRNPFPFHALQRQLLSRHVLLLHCHRRVPFLLRRRLLPRCCLLLLWHCRRRLEKDERKIGKKKSRPRVSVAMEEESTSSLSTRNGEEKKEQKRGVEQITLMNESIVYSFTSLSVSDLGPYQKHISRSHPPDRQRNHSGLGTTTVCCRRGFPPATEQLAW